jgi:hypothetical protein
VLAVPISKRWAEEVAVLVEVEVGLVMVVSALVLLTLTELVNGPALVTVTTMLILTVAPAATVPRLHVTTVTPEHKAVLCARGLAREALSTVPKVADTKLTPAGSVSVRITPEASEDPVLVSATLKVVLLPTTENGGSVC